MELYNYIIVSSRNKTRARLAWRSPVTDLTYCGICLKGVIVPRIGAECAVCQSEVSQIFNLKEGKNAVKSAWQRALDYLGT
jgi:hypothetical protein